MGRVCGGLLVQSRTYITNPEHNDNTNTYFLYRGLTRHVDNKVLDHIHTSTKSTKCDTEMLILTSMYT
jgi:hypothetical protein